ncbi:2-phosphosulfolactate phosphatase [Phytoactinopolyspora halotolerans]|uniref:Probable 2-phosphosulfolactate phosphatase n=1 Tax=Phytoactinopolyspora halotolerans TaxID=1981512 RepID=A0A6L9SAQ6_9ACTN|nr:2-phosphosulfolactate phosphatase [Phytoactinopolyspora halotolerans]NEE01080.1 2-phosphosulfolactate phosphatase [Phytoactinopolyspora halotolerans]
MPGALSQDDARIRLEWGPRGASETSAGAGFAVVVDVLSFTTTLSVAVDRGIDVFPYRWKDNGAIDFAQAHSATLAVGRLEAQRQPGYSAVSLSPFSVREADGLGRLVLPSPNGSTICSELADTGATVLGACLRNRSAVARWLAAQLDSPSSTAITVVAAGERWPGDGSLRPAVEDMWGAGAVVAALEDLGAGPLSPEAATAAGAFRAVQPSLSAVLARCSSGRELSEAGFSDDVRIASELDASICVPVLRGSRFVNAA